MEEKTVGTLYVDDKAIDYDDADNLGAAMWWLYECRYSFSVAFGEEG